MVIYPDADISEPDNDTDEDLAKELFDASDDDDIKKVQEDPHTNGIESLLRQRRFTVGVPTVH
ncbi:hypothetical protein T08_15055 [Trichinella sp. T8]|nr:hypothetical protein T08_15055 [Trichinella sp. T8]